MSILLDTYLAEKELPHFEDEDLALFWLFDQMTPEDRSRWNLEFESTSQTLATFNGTLAYETP